MAYTIKMSLDRNIYGFRYALTGIKVAWREEINFKIQVGCALVALFLAWFFRVSPIEWMVIIFLIGSVLSAEAFNTALEEFCDMVKNDPDPHIAKIKDLAAAAVFIASATALVVGVIIFLPRFLALL